MSDTRLDHARDVLRLEADAVRAQIDQLGAPFLAACDLLLATRGHIIVTGLGKSGHIGEKIAATLASTGTPAFFVHAAEAGHGDLGMITADDTILAISYSGESQEILMMLPIVRALGVKTIAITGRPQSALAQQADLHLPIIIEKEACPLGLAPTTSTTGTIGRQTISNRFAGTIRKTDSISRLRSRQLSGRSFMDSRSPWDVLQLSRRRRASFRRRVWSNK